MLTISLTGERRYRVQQRLFRQPIVVLQVQYRVEGYEADYNGRGSDVDYVDWRDAKVEDITRITEGGAT